MANQRPAIVRAILWMAVVGITQVGSTRLAVAQLATIDLDQLSKISYCLGAMKEQEQKLFDHSHCNNRHNLGTPTTEDFQSKLCKVEEKAKNELKNKEDRFTIYVLSRTIGSDAALSAATGAMFTGSSDMTSCFEEADAVSRSGTCDWTRKSQDWQSSFRDCVEPPQNAPGPCRRTWVCVARELPY
jgi:hypothetical protein